MAYKQSPFPMIGGTKGHNKYKERQEKKAARLTAKAERQEKKAAEAKAFTKEQYGGEGSLFAFQSTGKRSRRRAERAEAKAAAGSRKAWKEVKKGKVTEEKAEEMATKISQNMADKLILGKDKIMLPQVEIKDKSSSPSIIKYGKELKKRAKQRNK